MNNDYRFYTVERGDTLWDIARMHGMGIRALLAIPGNESYRPRPNLIYPGQKILVPTRPHTLVRLGGSLR